MKKLTAVILTLAIMLTFVACSNDRLKNDTDKNTLEKAASKASAEKDNSAVSEIVNAIRLSLSDQDVYDALLCYTAYGNVSCYIDKSRENDITAKKIVTKMANEEYKEQYTYGDDARTADKTQYFAAGNMRGMTITFQPDKNRSESIILIGDAVINKFVRPGEASNLVTQDRDADMLFYVNGEPNLAENGTLSTMAYRQSLYNRIRSIVGTEIKLNSTVYRNSEYTVFVRIGLSGTQDSVDVYGQWNGTNLP